MSPSNSSTRRSNRGVSPVFGSGSELMVSSPPSICRCSHGSRAHRRQSPRAYWQCARPRGVAEAQLPRSVVIAVHIDPAAAQLDVRAGPRQGKLVPRPAASSPEVLRRMRGQGRRDTRPELLLRRRLHHMGFRYFVDRAVLPGSRRRHDVVFSTARVLVDVRGCFWHRCPDHFSLPVANRDWWAVKLQANVDRDCDTEARAQAAGWLLLVVWEHDDMDEAATVISAVVRQRKLALSGKR